MNSVFTDSPVLGDCEQYRFNSNATTSLRENNSFIDVPPQINNLIKSENYKSEWTITNRTLFLCIIFSFDIIVNAFTLGYLLEESTTIDFGPVECLFSTFLINIAYSFFGLHSVVFFGTHPMTTIFFLSVSRLCKWLNLAFLPYLGWTGIWASLFLIMYGILSFYRRFSSYVTFTWDISAGMVLLVLLYEAYHSMNRIFTAYEISTSLVSLWLATCCCVFATLLYLSKLWKILSRPSREILSTIGPFLVFITFIGLQHVPFSTTPVVAKLDFPDTAWHRSDGLKNIFSLNQLLSTPQWAVFLAVVSGFSFALMLIQIHNSTISAITTGKDGGEVSSGWDFILMGLVTLVMSLFGFPVIGSLQTHNVSYFRIISWFRKTGRLVGERDNDCPIPTVLGGRLTIFLAACLQTSFLLPGLVKLPRLIPKGVLVGILTHLAFSSFSASSLPFQLQVLLNREDNDEPYGNLKKRHVLQYLLIQLFLGGILFALFLTPGAVLYPFILYLLNLFGPVALSSFLPKDTVNFLSGKSHCCDDVINDISMAVSSVSMTSAPKSSFSSDSPPEFPKENEKEVSTNVPSGELGRKDLSMVQNFPGLGSKVKNIQARDKKILELEVQKETAHVEEVEESTHRRFSQSTPLPRFNLFPDLPEDSSGSNRRKTIGGNSNLEKTNLVSISRDAPLRRSFDLPKGKSLPSNKVQEKYKNMYLSTESVKFSTSGVPPVSSLIQEMRALGSFGLPSEKSLDYPQIRDDVPQANENVPDVKLGLEEIQGELEEEVLENLPKGDQVPGKKNGGKKRRRKSKTSKNTNSNLVNTLSIRFSEIENPLPSLQFLARKSAKEGVPHG